MKIYEKVAREFSFENIWSILKRVEARKSTIVSEGFKGGTRGAPIMPRDAVSRTANVGT